MGVHWATVVVWALDAFALAISLGAFHVASAVARRSYRRGWVDGQLDTIKMMVDTHSQSEFLFRMAEENKLRLTLWESEGWQWRLRSWLRR